MNVDTKLLCLLGDPLPIEGSPFARMASRAGMDEQSLCALLRRWKKRGIVRRIGAVLDQGRIGFGASALVAWNVPAGRVGAAGRALSRLPAVSHCYARRAYRSWPYRLYTMVHARDRKACLDLIEEMARSIRASGYRALFTVQELKKQKMKLAGVLG